MIPTTIPACLAALNAAYATLGEDDALALASALEQASPVNTIVQSFDVLRLVTSLDNEGLIALAGCARLISANAWHARGADASALLIDRAAEIAALPKPTFPAIPVPEAITDLDG
jgi:hypothetical protein